MDKNGACDAVERLRTRSVFDRMAGTIVGAALHGGACSVCVGCVRSSTYVNIHVCLDREVVIAKR